MRTEDEEADGELLVGVTGHRVLAEPRLVREGVAEAMCAIESRFPGRTLTAVSSLAEGADRLVAYSVLARPGGRLVAVLPLPAADYRGDFSSAASAREFDELLARAHKVIEVGATAGAPDGREEAYREAGLRMLDLSEVLIAIWDGELPRGRGGTGEIVRRAHARGLPIAWVRAGNRRSDTGRAVSLGPAQGFVTLEGF